MIREDMADRMHFGTVDGTLKNKNLATAEDDSINSATINN